MIVSGMCALIVGGLTVWHDKSLGFRVEKAGTGGSAAVDGAGKGPAVTTYPRREIASGDTRTGRAP